jgi:hypothetical protein
LRIAHLFGWTLADIDRLSIADVGDCMGYWRAEMQLKRDQRAHHINCDVD